MRTTVGPPGVLHTPFPDDTPGCRPRRTAHPRDPAGRATGLRGPTTGGVTETCGRDLSRRPHPSIPRESTRGRVGPDFHQKALPKTSPRTHLTVSSQSPGSLVEVPFSPVVTPATPPSPVDRPGPSSRPHSRVRPTRRPSVPGTGAGGGRCEGPRLPSVCGHRVTTYARVGVGVPSQNTTGVRHGPSP